MKNFNFALAKTIILTSKNLSKGQLGMDEDWFWTAEEAWSAEKGFNKAMFKSKEVGHVGGSFWATPVLQLTFKCGKVEVFNCFTGQTEVDALEKAKNEADCTGGCLSTATQDWRAGLKVLQPAALN